MSPGRWFPGILTLLTVLTGCTGPPRPDETVDRSEPLPVGLVLQREISGQVLGRVVRLPVGVEVNRRGTVFLVDSGNDRLIRFDSDLTPQRAIGSPGMFEQPQYLVIDHSPNLWLADYGNYRLVRCSEQLEYIDEIDLRDEADPLRFGRPVAPAITEFGEVWVTDADNDQVLLLDNLGRFDRFVGGFGYTGGQLRDPAKILSGPDGNFYICDAGNGRVVVYDEYGSFDTEIGRQVLNQPRAAAFDKQGRLWVLDGTTGRIDCFDRQGRVLASVGPVVSGAERSLKNPSDLAFDPRGRLLISDTGNDRLLVCQVVFDQGSPNK